MQNLHTRTVTWKVNDNYHSSKSSRTEVSVCEHVEKTLAPIPQIGLVGSGQMVEYQARVCALVRVVVEAMVRLLVGHAGEILERSEGKGVPCE